MSRQYTRQQLVRLLARSGATSWQEALDYLARYPDGADDVNAEQVFEMAEDLEEMKRRGEPFTPDAGAILSVVTAFQNSRSSGGTG